MMNLLSLALLAQTALSLPLTEVLRLSQVLKRSPTGTKASDYAVTTLPGLDKLDPKYVPEMYAGYIEANEASDEDYFFWKFSKDHTSEDAKNRLIFWFNGGPGCSSLDGAVDESGPLGTDENGNVVYRKGSWLETGDLVFVDQPGGVGFSNDHKYATELKDIATDMLQFIHNYYKVFPEDKSKELYLSGESYAGQYIPYFGAKILSEAPDINLKGLIILNGYIYPDIQNSVLYDFVTENGVITKEEAKSGDWQLQQCIKTYESNEKEWALIIKEMETKGEYSGNKDSGSRFIKTDSYQCSNILLDIMETIKGKGDCFSVYDTRINGLSEACQSGVFPLDQKNVDNFLNLEAVQKALNLQTKMTWSECDSGRVGQALANRFSYPAYFKLPYLLDRIDVLIAAGKNDIICNIKGLEKMVSRLTWGGKSSPGFSSDTKENAFAVDGKVYGLVKKEGKLMFAGVDESSHMIPYSQPVGSRGLIDVFFGNYKDENGVFEAKSYGDY